MKFEAFVSTLVLAFIQHEFMQDEILAAGIELQSLDHKLDAVQIFKTYLNKRKTMSHAKAAFELEGDLRLLELMGEPLTAIPKDPVVLAEKFKDLHKAHQFEQLSKALSEKPEKGEDLIKDFQLRAGDAVESQTLAELSLMVNHHHAQAKEQKSVVEIKHFRQLSQMIGGFNPERLGIFLGGTGFGKTNFAVNLSLAAIETMNVVYVNMEMGFSDMVKRFSVIASGTSYADYAKGNYDAESVAETLRDHGQNLLLTSGRSLSFEQIAAWVRLQAKKKKLGLVIIDYDQKVDLNLKYQLEEWKALQKVMEAFEDLAKELELYVLILAQVNRDGLISGSHRAQFPAHTVLSFYEHETHGPIIEAKKNRHGKKSQGLKVFYDERNSRISEVEVVTVEKVQPQKPERKTLAPVQKKFGGMF